MSRFIDISPVIDVTLISWPGDTPFTHTFNLHMERGDNITLSDVRMSTHLGAHADAPSHYVREGADIASRALEYYVGLCQVISVHGARGGRIMPADVRTEVHAPRVLFKTGSFDLRRWNRDFVALSPEVIDFLHERGVLLVGIDTPSIDPFGSKPLEAHQALARNDMANLEGLILDEVEPGMYELIAPPLRIAGADGSPLRALLRTL